MKRSQKGALECAVWRRGPDKNRSWLGKIEAVKRNDEAKKSIYKGRREDPPERAKKDVQGIIDESMEGKQKENYVRETVRTERT